MADRDTILLVDDDDVFRQVTARALARYGYACAEADNARSALDLLESDRSVALVLCDIRMPGRSGLELLRDITADHPDVAVVMMTGLDRPATAELAFDIGAYGYVVKPFEVNELLINVGSALKRRALELQRRAAQEAPAAAAERTHILSGVLDRVGEAHAEVDESDLIERLSLALSLRDEETGRHLERMGRYTAVLADAIGFDEMTLDEIRLAATLHDVGKIGVPDGILLKPGSLLPDEYAVMQRHAQLGYRLLSSSSSAILDVAAVIALAHHEWWDGTGYPRGLRGEDIPLVARIAAVADVYDALTSNRVYRAAMAPAAATELMIDLRGKQFEPRLIDAFFARAGDLESIREQYSDAADGDTRIRVLVVDDHAVFVESLVRLLSTKPAVKVVGAVGSVADARLAAAGYRPDVVLMDFELPDGDGAMATEHIKALLPAAKVVMLTGRTDDFAMVRAIEAGCSGFVTKVETADAVLAAIVDAHNGEAVGPPAQLAALLRRLRPTQRGLGAALGPREREVLTLVAAGLGNKQIAQRLGLQLNTVRNHVQNSLYKLNAHSKLEAVATAVREGLVEYPVA